jgi:hypothetical protein
MEFKIGDIVEHILSKDWLLILEINEETNQYYCRTKTHQVYWFESFELKERKQ